MLLIRIISNVLFFLSFFFLISVHGVERLPDAFKNSGVQEKLGGLVDFNSVLYNEAAEKVNLNSFLGQKPILLNFAYYTCPKLCHLVVDGMTEALIHMPKSLIDDIKILTISFDHRDNQETTSMFKEKHVKKLSSKFKKELNWDFLYGSSDSVKKIADSVGFQYMYDAKSSQYSHPSCLIFISPEGKVTRYLYGIVHNSFDVKMSLIESKKNNILSTVESMLMFCYNYDPNQKGFVLQAVKLMKIAAVVTVFVLFFFLFLLFKSEGMKNG